MVSVLALTGNYFLVDDDITPALLRLTKVMFVVMPASLLLPDADIYGMYPNSSSVRELKDNSYGTD